MHTTPSTDLVDDLEEVEGRLYRLASDVQSEELVVFAGAAAGVVDDVFVLELESLDLVESLDLLESLDPESLDPESLDDEVLDDEDFDLPPRLSVL